MVQGMGVDFFLIVGFHFGHYMAGTFNLDILIFNVTMAELPMKTGYLPRRWREGLNVMLKKTWKL